MARTTGIRQPIGVETFELRGPETRNPATGCRSEPSRRDDQIFGGWDVDVIATRKPPVKAQPQSVHGRFRRLPELSESQAVEADRGESGSTVDCITYAHINRSRRTEIGAKSAMCSESSRLILRIMEKAYPFDYGTATCCAGGLTAGSPDSGGIRAAATRRPVRSRKDRDSGGLGVGAAGRGGVRARVRGRQAAASVRSRYVAGGSPRPMPRSRSKEVRLWRRRFHRKTNSSR